MLATPLVIVGLTAEVMQIAYLPFEVRVEDIKIAGLTSHSTEDVLEALGVTYGDDLVRPKETILENRLIRQNWIYSVDVTVNEYGEMDIKIVER